MLLLMEPLSQDLSFPICEIIMTTLYFCSDELNS